MTSTTLITGGTGTLGRHVVPLLREAGASLRVLSRKPHEPLDDVRYVTGDLRTDDGVAAAVDGARIVLHLAGGPKGDEVAARNLARAAANAGVEHLVFISVVAADRVPLNYFRTKLAAEQAVSDSGVPWTTLRAAQFHDLVLAVVGSLGRSPVVPVLGGVRAEPVDVREVARLVELTLGAPAGFVPDLARPEVRTFEDLSRAYLRARDRRRPTVPIRMPGAAGRVYRAGENLAGDGAQRGTRTWEDFLAERYAARPREPHRR